MRWVEDGHTKNMHAWGTGYPTTPLILIMSAAGVWQLELEVFTSMTGRKEPGHNTILFLKDAH